MSGEPIIRCVFGRRGSGKTTFARSLAADAEKAVVFDPMGDYRGRPWRAATTRQAFLESVIDGVRRSDLHIAYTPNLGDTADLIDEAAFVAGIVRKIQRGFPHRDDAPLMLVIDEANLAYPEKRARSRAVAPITALILQGRHAGIGVTFVTQRPALIGMDARSQAAETYCFALSHPADLVAISQSHPQADRLLRLAPKFGGVKLTDDGASLFSMSKDGRTRPIKTRLAVA